MTEQHAQRANPFAQFGNKPYRMGGEKTPAATGPIKSKVYSIRYDVRRTESHASFNLTFQGNSGIANWFAADDAVIVKALTAYLDGKPLEINGRYRPEQWEMVWYQDDKHRPVAQKITNLATGEVLAEADAQPQLIEVPKAADGLPATEGFPAVKSTSPFGAPLTEEQKAQAQRDGEIARAKVAELQAAKEREAMANADTAPLVAAAITQGKDDPTPTPSPDEPSALDAHFGPKEKPLPAKALINGKHWQKDDKARTDFFKAYTSLCNKHQVPYANHTREKLRAAAQGTEHLEQYPGTADELLAACAIHAEAEYPLAMAGEIETIKSSDLSPENDSTATPTPETPTTPASDEKPSVSSGNEIKVLQDTISALQKKINELEAKQEPAKMNNPDLPEAPFSANFHLRNKRGVRIQYTIRAQTVQDGTERVDALIDILLEKRGFALDESLPARTASNGSPAPASSESGASLCALIKVGKSYTGNKSQLQFECDGFDQPLRYTRDNLAQVLANAKQMNGNPFTSNDLTDGRKFGGEWMVEWKKEQGQDGKNHINVISVRNAA